MKTLTKSQAAERLGISEQMLMLYLKRLKAKPPRGPVQTSRGTQYKVVIGPTLFRRVEGLKEKIGRASGGGRK